MKRQYLLLLLVAGLITFFSACTNQVHYKALIVTGQNNHNWQASNPVLKQLLDQTGLFTTDIIITPEKGGDMTTFNPKFSKYDVIVLDYNGDSWTEKTNTAFLDFVRKGGGVVVYHAADNAFPEWKEYNKIIGLGGWGNRNEKDGPYVFYRGKDIIRDDTSKGIGGTHGPRSEYSVKTRNFEHPIMKSMPANWMHGNDELYSRLRGPAENMEILATANSGSSGFGRGAGAAFPGAPGVARTAPGTPGAAGTQAARAPGAPGAPAGGQGFRRQQGRDEPVLMTITYGKGRIFHTVLGHADEGGGPAMECVGFIVTFQRGAEWAASGKVTQEVPNDFPSAAGVVLRTGFVAPTLEDDFANIGNYGIEKSTKYFTDIQKDIRKAANDEKALLEIEGKIVKVLENPAATVDAKKLLLRELSWMGSDLCIPAIKNLSSNAELKDEVEYALARLQAPK